MTEDELRALSQFAKDYPENGHRVGDFRCAITPRIVLGLLDEIDSLRQRVKELEADMEWVERCANHHGQKPNITAEQALSMIQHYPPVKQITKSYSNGKVPTTQDPYAELEATPEPLTDIELQALVICKADGRVSVSKVQRVLCIGYNEAGEICQSIIDKGQCDDLELAPSLTRRAAMYRNGEKVDTSDTTCIEGHPV